MIRSFNEDESMIRFINYEDSTTSDFKLFELTDKSCTNNLLSLLAGRQEAGQQYCVFSEVSLSVNQPFLDIVRNKIRMHGDKYSFSSIFGKYGDGFVNDLRKFNRWTEYSSETNANEKCDRLPSFS